MGDLTFQQETVEEVIDDIKPLVEQHHQESSFISDLPLDPNFDNYFRLEENKVLRVYTARKSGQLVGYAIYIVMNSTYHRTILEATQSLIFIPKEHRGFGSSFLKWITEELEAEGVDLVYAHISLSSRTPSALMLRHGFELSDLVYMKRIRSC